MKTFITHKTSEKLLKHFWALKQMLPLATTAPEQLSTTQASLPPTETSKGPSKASDQSLGVEMVKGKEASQGRTWLEDKGKGKEAKTL